MTPTHGHLCDMLSEHSREAVCDIQDFDSMNERGSLKLMHDVTSFGEFIWDSLTSVCIFLDCTILGTETPISPVIVSAKHCAH